MRVALGDVHVIDQEGQPYGSVRRCCNQCGLMAVPGMRYVNSLAQWRVLQVRERCDWEAGGK